MGRSPAKSVVLECIRIVFSSFPEHETALQLAVEKVKEFVAAVDDPNLRFLGLHALTILKPGQSWAVEENREAIVKSLADSDPNIRQEALRLIMNMVFETNLVEISAILINYSSKADPEFSNEILETILATCSRNFYELVMDFDWYVSLLAEMVRNPHFMKGEEVERQLVDIALRVKEARPQLVHVARDLLIDPALLENPFLHRVHSAVAWISGEFIKFSRNPMEIVEALLQPRTSFLPSLVRAVYIQAVFKVVTFCFISFMNVGVISDSKSDIDKNTDGASEDDSDEALFKHESLGMKELLTSKSILYMLNLILKELSPLSECDEVEVQERARNVLGFVHTLSEIDWSREEEHLRSDMELREIANFMNAVFSEELGPVSIHAQKRVPLPEGIELKENLNDLVEILGNDYIVPSTSISFTSRTRSHNEDKPESVSATESTSLLAEHRKRHGLYYLSTTKDDDGSSDYPRATDSTSVHTYSTTEDLLKLAVQSSVPRLTKPSKPRPTVVKLDEYDDSLSSSSNHAKEPQRDVLFGNEKPHSDNYTQRMVKEASTASDLDSLSKEKSWLGEEEIVSSSSRKEKHNGRGKERQRGTKKNESKEEKSHRSSASSSYHRGRHKHKHRGESGDASSNIAPQTHVFEDFLL